MTGYDTIQKQAAQALTLTQEGIRDGRLTIGEALDSACLKAADGDEHLAAGLNNIATGWLVTASFELGREGQQTVSASVLIVRAKTLLLEQVAAGSPLEVL
jgi:hypothetical protein